MDERLSKEIICKRNQAFYSRGKQNSATNTSRASAERAASSEQRASVERYPGHIWQPPGCFCALCCIAAVFWKVANTELHVSPLGERRELEREGRDSVPSRPMLQIGPDWASSDPEKQPKQEEGCEFMTKQNTQSQRDTLLGEPSYRNLSPLFLLCLSVFFGFFINH